MAYQEVLQFWFEEIEEKQWWVKDQALDELIKSRFAPLHAQVAACEKYHWRHSAEGRLAEIIVLDQFSRNMFRDTAASFAYDALALALAQEAVDRGADQELEGSKRDFIYMPYMHSESPLIHEKALALFTDNSSAYTIDFEVRHKDIIDEFGRYPHRNEILNRPSTAQELEFLKQDGSSF